MLEHEIHSAINLSKDTGEQVTLDIPRRELNTAQRLLSEEAEEVLGTSYRGIDIDGNRWCVRLTTFGAP